MIKYQIIKKNFRIAEITHYFTKKSPLFDHLSLRVLNTLQVLTDFSAIKKEVKEIQKNHPSFRPTWSYSNDFTPLIGKDKKFFEQYVHYKVRIIVIIILFI